MEKEEIINGLKKLITSDIKIFCETVVIVGVIYKIDIDKIITFANKNDLTYFIDKDGFNIYN